MRKCVNAVVNNADTDKLSSSSYETSVSEIVDGLHKAIECTEKPVSKAIVKMERDCTEIEEDGKHLKSELRLSRNELRQAINEIKDDAIREIKGASLETIGEVISNQLGVQNDQVTFYVFQDKLSAQIEQCCEANANNVNVAAVKIQNTYSMQDAMLNDAVKYGVG